MWARHAAWFAFGHAGQQRRHDLADVADQADIDLHVLVDLGAIDLDVDLPGVQGIGLEVAGDAVVEAHAQGHEQVGLLDRLVDPGLAVHAHHPQVERMRSGDAADAEQGHGNRDVGVLGKLPHDVAGAGGDDAVAGQDDRALRGLDEGHGGLQVGVLRGQIGPAGGRRAGFGPGELARLLLAVLGQVDEHRAGAAGASHVERFAHRGGDVLGLRDQVVVLGDRQRDAGDVAFLERVGPDELAADLASDADDGRRIHHRRGDARDQVGGPGARGGDGHADLAGGPGITVGHVRRALFVADQHVADGVVEHRVIGREDGSARVAEHAGDALPHEGLPQDLGAGQFRWLHLMHKLLSRS